MIDTEFKEMREKMRLTQKEVAARLDVAENSVYRWETGRAAIPKTVELAMKQLRLQIFADDVDDLDQEPGILKSVLRLND